jgi:hypothetical protein
MPVVHLVFIIVITYHPFIINDVRKKIFKSMRSIFAFGYLPYLYFLKGTIFKIPLLMIDEVCSYIGLLIPYIVS